MSWEGAGIVPLGGVIMLVVQLHEQLHGKADGLMHAREGRVWPCALLEHGLCCLALCMRT
jgi:hypothetical protein